MRVMKTVGKEMKRKGVTMKRYFDNFPLCCPARIDAAHRPVRAQPPRALELAPRRRLRRLQRAPRRQLPAAVAAGGRLSDLVRRQVRERLRRARRVRHRADRRPAGWDDWHVFAPSRAQYFNYTLNQNGTLRQYTSAEEDYSTDVFTKKAKRCIRVERAGLRPRSTSSSATPPRTAAAAATLAARATAPRSPRRATSAR